MKAQKGTYKKSVFLCLFILGIIVFWSFQVSAIELNEGQKEVWKTVEASWNFFLKGDFKGFNALALERAFRWNPEGWHPNPKKFWYGNLSERRAFNKPVSYELKPVAIEIVGDTATVYYYYKWKGEQRPDASTGRTLSALIKQNGNWKLFGSMDCSCDMLPDCLEGF